MKLLAAITLFLGISATLYCQEQESPFSLQSVFDHLPTITLQKTNAPAPRPYYCFSEKFFDQNGVTTSFDDVIPTKVFATKMSISANPLVQHCTLWTIDVNLNWQQTVANTKDTLHIFIREATPPYTEIYHSKYLMKIGDNIGEIEVDPPVPPYSRPLLGNPRDLFIGLYVTGTPGNKITWRFKNPGVYYNPPRSYVFTTPTTPVPAPGVVGNNWDWMFGCVYCCEFIPVELSVFFGRYLESKIQLEWKTESETNNHHFEIQRAIHNDGPWESRGFVPGNGSTRMAHWYTFTDPLLNYKEKTQDAYWYRIVQMDFDGTESILPAIRVNATPLKANSFKLNIPYPNPISQNQYTTIGFELADESPVTITIYNALGKEVATLIDRVMPAGYHEAIWYTGNYTGQLRKGTYLILMKTGLSTTMQKVTIL